MKLIFAQGNPGPDYAKSRHNIGWRVLDAYAKEQGATLTTKSKFTADIAELSSDRGEKILLVKPLTYYNETGQSLRSLVDFYKLDPARDILVLHDELMLPLGKIRVRPSGRDAGNNGIKSLNVHIGEQYQRIRIGIWNEYRDRMNDTSFVLEPFSKPENELLNATIIPHAIRLVDDFLSDRLQHTSSSLV